LSTWLAADRQTLKYSGGTDAASTAAAPIWSVKQEQPAMLAFNGGLLQLVRMNQNIVAADSSQGRAAADQGNAELAITLALCTVLALMLGTLISRSIVRPLREVQQATRSLAERDIRALAEAMSLLADGDLTVHVASTTVPPHYTSRDEIGQTAAVTRTMVGTVRESISAYESARRAPGAHRSTHECCHEAHHAGSDGGRRDGASRARQRGDCARY
jgi:methyl-accepting chemotaxis protein